MASKRSPEGPIEELVARALHLHRSGKQAQAEQAYRDVLSRAPDHADALHFYGMWLHEHGRTAAAVEHLERARAAAPDSDQIENNLAGLYLLADRPDDAERMFKGILARAPDAVPPRFNLGVLYARSKRWSEAVAELEATRALRPDLDVLRELGDALIEVGRFADAVAVHQEGMALALGEPEQRRSLSRAYGRLVEHLEASGAEPRKTIAELRNWLAIDPDAATAREKLAALGGQAPDAD